MIRETPLIPIITGPTASGKSAVAMKLCEITGGELVSCDSMQIYRGLDIGTAKPTGEEQAAVPHHLIDIIDPGTDFSVSVFVRLCTSCIEDIIQRGKLPVLCGGTGQYISALKDGLSFEGDPEASEITADLYAEYERCGIEDIYRRLSEADPEAALKIHPNNTRRVIRALAVYMASGRTFSQRNTDSRKSGPLYPFRLFEIDYEDDRASLYDRINRRVDLMADRGLEEEARYLYSLPIDRKSTCCQAIGYKEFLPLIDGVPGASSERAIYEIKLNTRHFAKRQLTWFRYIKEMNRIDRESDPSEAAEYIIKVLSDS